MALAIKTPYAEGNTVDHINLNALVTEAGDGAATFNASQGSHDFVVKSSGNANMLKVDGTNNAVSIGGEPNTTTAAGLAYKMTVNGDLYVKDDDGYTLALFEQTSTNSPENATVIIKAANLATLQLFDSGASTDMGVYNISAGADNFSVGTISDTGDPSTTYVMFDTYRQTISSTDYIIFKHNMIPPASVASSLPVGAIYQDSGTVKIKT